jgi:tRNA pseudouridine32 synthase / 23S rRNA pseudouridine746 synthase
VTAGTVRDGVGVSSVALPPGEWPTVLAFLSQRFPRIPAHEWQTRMAAGDVCDAQGQAVPPSAAYLPYAKVPGAKLYYYRSVAVELPIPFTETVLHQDAHIVVADKPHFLPVTPSGRYLQETLLVRLKRRLRLDDLVPLHRIDRDTAGLVPASRGAYAALFRERNIVKHYEAVAPWREGLGLPRTLHSRIVPSEAYMVMQEEQGPPNAETHIALIAHLEGGAPGLAHYSLSPHTGRRHQLRVQMAGLGVPMVNDHIYPVLSPECPLGTAPNYSQPLQLLAKRLAFNDPLTGAARVFESRLRLQVT